MTNWIQTGHTFIAAMRKQSTTTLVSIARTDENGVELLTANVNATIGRTRDQSDEAYGGIIREESRDYLIEAVDYVFGSNTGPVPVPTTPMQGDRIIESDGAVYQVLPDGGLSAWDWHDSSRTTYRVRCKGIA